MGDAFVKYDIGLDIGTNSLGWAVADQNGELLRYKRRPMCGTVLIQTEGQTASKTRGFRSSRRRLIRKRQRIQWLQELMEPIVLKDDPLFYERLKYSYVSRDDDSCEINPDILFDNEYYKTHVYHDSFPTIYQLRKAIATEDKKFDIRLVYLAIHHIIKYRGNFLYEGQSISVNNLNIKDAIMNMLVELGCIEEDDGTALADVIETSIREPKRKGEKFDDINLCLLDVVPDCVEEAKKKAWAKAVAQLIMGYKADIASIFGLEEPKKVSFEDENYEEAEEVLDDVQILQFESIQKVYSSQVLINILSGDVKTISDAYITVYESHKEDLKILKRLLKEYASDKYNLLINDMSEKAHSYARYIDSTRSCSNEVLCKAVKDVLLSMPQENPDVRKCLARIEDQNFLLKPRNSNNGAIPNQLHCEELELIIDNQSRFYPELGELKDKILSIASYRIPYYVGPLSKNSPFAWVERTDEKIRPWNFYDVVDTKATAKAFIRRMTNKCSYLFAEDVLPKKSLLYSEYVVLEELTNVRVNNKSLASDCKLAAIDELFKKHKSVSLTMFRDWYRTNYMKGEEKAPYISGLSDTSKFLSNMSSYIDLTAILGGLDTDEKIETAEKIIEMITLFEDKKIRESEIRDILPDATEWQIAKLMKLNYTGWARFSKKLLTGIFTQTEEFGSVSIMDLIKKTEQNFMQILYNKKYSFEQLIEKENQSVKDGKTSAKDLIFNYAGSPAVKKCTWIATKVVDEIEAIIGCPPSNIYVEVASGNEKKRKTFSRYKSLDKQFSKIIKEDENFRAVYAKLKAFSDRPKELDKKSLYLYFLQNGKCMYTGEPLDIKNLSNYQIDHILPRCYIKDDSFDNTVLVKASANQRKLDSLLLNEEIINKQYRNWEMLYKNHLISKKKFDNLCRKSIDDNAMEGFINRQLNETRQICTCVFSALKLVYSNKVNVYGVSAKLSFNLKQRIGLPKIRELNDYHHAVDAYTAILSGSFAQRRLSIPKGELNELYRYSLKQEGTERCARYGIIADLFCTVSSAWNGPKHQVDLMNCAMRHDFYMNCLTEEQTGEFYNQIPKCKDNNPENQIPRKKGMKPEIYGGYSGENDAYFCIVEDKGKPKKKAFSLVGVPIRIAEMQKQDKNAIIDFFKSKGIDNPVIRKDKIKKYQHILYDEGDAINDFYMVGAEEVINAKQLWLSSFSIRVLDSLLHFDPDRKAVCSDLDIQMMYEELCDRVSKYYPCYKAIGEACRNYKDVFMSLSRPEKVKHLNNILIATHANSKRVDKPNWKRVNNEGESIEMNIPGSRLSKRMKPENIEFIDSSITGMHSRSYKLEL